MRLTLPLFCVLLLSASCGEPEDADGDGSTALEDCDDEEASVFPGADEACDGVDNDCDGLVDEDFEQRSTFWIDADGDGFGNPAASVEACAATEGTVEDATDCDDRDSRRFPGADETCDGRDEDCDGEVDNDPIDRVTFYDDDDGDGFGDPTTAVEACGPPEGSTTDATDCDDTDGSISPVALERCNGIDDDCDGWVDAEDNDLLDGGRWYPDADGDGYGDAAGRVVVCDRPDDYVANAFDCDDGDAGVHPSAAEVCNDIDDDCDGWVDSDDLDLETSTLQAIWVDGDGDGYGAGDVVGEVCDVPSGFAAADGDCDDEDSETYPGAPDTPDDGIDQNCDGTDATAGG